MELTQDDLDERGWEPHLLISDARFITGCALRYPIARGQPFWRGDIYLAGMEPPSARPAVEELFVQPHANLVEELVPSTEYEEPAPTPTWLVREVEQAEAQAFEEAFEAEFGERLAEKQRAATDEERQKVYFNALASREVNSYEAFRTDFSQVRLPPFASDASLGLYSVRWSESLSEDGTSNLVPQLPYGGLRRNDDGKSRELDYTRNLAPFRAGSYAFDDHGEHSHEILEGHAVRNARRPVIVLPPHDKETTFALPHNNELRHGGVSLEFFAPPDYPEYEVNVPQYIEPEPNAGIGDEVTAAVTADDFSIFDAQPMYADWDEFLYFFDYYAHPEVAKEGASDSDDEEAQPAYEEVLP